MSISLSQNDAWINPETRPANKYAPVTVDKVQNSACEQMSDVLLTRKQTCSELGYKPIGGYTFTRADQLSQRNYRSHTIPIIVLSGGASGKIKLELDRDLALAWHPLSSRGKPVYIFVHQLDYATYERTLRSELSRYKNLFLVGWNGGGLTGFGAARSAALAYAQSLPYLPDRILLMDQDVISTESTRHTAPRVEAQVSRLHGPQNQVVGYGVGYPERVKVPGIFDTDLPKPEKDDAKSPTQQFVSITAPFVRNGNLNLYPEFMVAGGEDMLMSLKHRAYDDAGKNTSLRSNARIFKMQLGGKRAYDKRRGSDSAEGDPHNEY